MLRITKKKKFFEKSDVAREGNLKEEVIPPQVGTEGGTSSSSCDGTAG